MGNEAVPSYWLEDFPVRDRPALSGALTTQVCIIGAGIAGLSTAYLLLRRGVRVVVLEDGAIGGGMTGFTTAHVTWVLDDRFAELERLHGQAGALLAANSHKDAVDTIERIVKDENIDCDFLRRDAYLFAPPGAPIDEIDGEFKAIERTKAFDAELVSTAPIEGFNTGLTIHFKDQAQFHPLKYLAGLADAIERHGGQIFCNTHATAVSGKDRHVETAGGFTVTADSIVVATNTPINDRLVIHTKQAPYTTYVIAIQAPEDRVVPALYWDTRQSKDEAKDGPYHYVRLAYGGGKPGRPDLLIVGGEDHKTAQDDGGDRFARLEAWARERWPYLGRVVHRWSGQVMEPIDGMAFIGRNPADEDNVYVATGDSGNGITHGTVAGLVLADLITGVKSPYEDLYDPGRITLKAAGDFAKENANVAAQFADYLKKGDVESEREIANGEGAVVRRGIKKIAVYRDEQGVLHRLSAVCPHLGCQVGWNHAEKTWDCPCHGSRFSADGEVINGPANTNLAEAESPADPPYQPRKARPLDRTAE